MKTKFDKKKLYISIYFSEMLNCKSMCRYGQPCCYLVEVTYDPDDSSDWFSHPPLMPMEEGGSANWKTLCTYVCDDWQRLDRVELDDATGLFPYLEETLIDRFPTPRVALDMAELACLYAHHANGCHALEPDDMIENFGILLGMDSLEAGKIAEAYVCGSESRCDDLQEFMNNMFLSLLKVNVRRAISEFVDHQPIRIG